jgi:hypothetical protein
MRLTRLFCSFSAAALALISSLAYAQATVVENEPSVLYVDAQSGSDSNSGSVSAPFKTIQAAVNKANANNQKSIGTNIIVNAGVYRETVKIDPVTGQTLAPLTVQAATAGAAIISASDVLNGWSADSQVNGAYITNWAPTQSTCALPNGWPSVQPIALHTEMVFVNGTPMTQVLEESDLKPGTFFVSTNDGALHVFPPAGIDPSSATIEAATRVKTISVVGRKNIVLRGLVFEHAANCINTSGATVTTSSNVLLDSIQANWNNSGGLAISSSTNVTVQNSIANYNGSVGFQGTKDQTTLYIGNETDYNNWRGAQAALYNWAMGGTKLFQMRTTTVRNHISYNNQAQGLWFDTDNKNITIDHVILSGSYNAALQLERNEGPITLQNSLLCSSGVGVNVLTTEGLTVANNVFHGNGATNKYQAQFYLAGSAGGINITDWQTGQVYNLVTTGTVLTGNTFIDNSSGQFVFGTYLSGSDWTDFTSTLKSTSNTWFDPNTATAFHIVNGKNVDLAGWRTATGADYNSVWSEPATLSIASCTAPPASYPDFSVTVDNGGYTMTSGRAAATIRVNSYNFGTVNLDISGLPKGVTASFSKPSLMSGASVLTLTASSSSTSQTVPVTLWGVSGDRVHNVTFNVAVTPNPGVVSTTTSLSASSSSITQGSAVTLTATVQPASGSTAPTGSVTFYNSGTALGTATLSAGVATLTTSALPAGADTVTASYAGTSTFIASSSNAVQVNVNSSAASTTTTLSASTATVTQNSPVTLTATVGANASKTAPTGTVTFYSGSAVLGSASLSGGIATVSTSNLPVGSDQLTAVYSGTNGFSSSTSNAISILVNPVVVSTSTTIAASSASVTQGSSVTFTATVAQSSGTIAPTGTVSFYNGAILIGSAPLAAGVATVSTSSLPTGTNSISAAYSGAVTFKASSSGVVVITVNAPAPTAVNTTTTLAASATSITQTSPVTFIANVAPASGNTMPTGTVNFLNGGAVIGSGTLISGVATFSTSALGVGTASITAAYAGTSSFHASNSSAVSVLVNPAAVATTTQLTTSAADISSGSTITLSAIVKQASGTSIPSGAVTFSIGNTQLGSAKLASGTATFSTSALPTGSNSITATYAGTSGFKSSSSPSVSVTVQPAAVATETSLAASASSIETGSSIAFTATVKVSSGSTIPSGTVTFFEESRSVATVTLSKGVASFTTSNLAEGHEAITAVYNGTPSFLKSSSNAVNITVTAKPQTALVGTRTAIASSVMQADQGFTICLTATVAPSTGTGAPQGDVVFSIGKRKVGSATLSSGKAYLITSALPVGNDAVSASYSGNGTFAPSTSEAITVKISGPDFTVAATPGSVSTARGTSAHIELLVTPKDGFNETLRLSCSDLPDGATCSFAPPVKHADGSSIVVMSIHTAVLSADARSSRMPFAVAFLPLLLGFSSKRRRQFRRFASLFLLFLAIVLFGSSAIGCGGRPSSSAQTSTETQTSKVTVTAEAGTGTTHTTTVQLTLM